MASHICLVGKSTNSVRSKDSAWARLQALGKTLDQPCIPLRHQVATAATPATDSSVVSNGRLHAAIVQQGLSTQKASAEEFAYGRTILADGGIL